ncbi:eCIS core domain-containing protein [Streptomyces sp. NPDC002248]
MQQRDEAREGGSRAERTANGVAGRSGGAAPVGGKHAALLSLQGRAGNAAVVQMLRQTAYSGPEQEAHVHDGGCGHEQVRKPDSPRTSAQGARPAVQRRSAVHDVLRGAGRPLDDVTRTDMESRLKADFSDVRVHDDASAKASAAELGALAYTSGSHIVMRAADRHTLAHELAHVIQQRKGPVSGTDHGDGVSVSDPSDRFEREAEATASRVLSEPAGQHAPALAAPAPEAAAAPGTAHAAGPGVTAQRMMRPSRRRAERDDPGRALAEAQIGQLAALPVMYVPAENFGRDGGPPPLPTRAYTAPEPGDAELLQVPGGVLPSVSHRDPGPRVSWPMKYQSKYFVYDIELVNRPDRPHETPTLIDPSRSFNVVRRKLKMRPSTHSAGRTYRFQERWSFNPVYWGSTVGPQAERAALDAGLKPEKRLAQRELRNFRALPAPPDQPFVFHVANDRVDPHFMNADGTQKDGRRGVSAASFDYTAATAHPDEYRRKTARDLSEPPQVGRGDAGRNPHRTMGNVQAHELMGVEGNGGSTGQHLASHEWCHLIGDGDGGADIPQNLVIGTNAVNTEQLAMETALRPFVPQLTAMGHSIQLDVEALVRPTPLDSPAVPGRGWNQAEYISYRISLVPVGQAGSSQRREIHRQIMDARRGTITEMEFTYLRRTVKAKLQGAVAAIEKADRAERERQAQAAALAYAGAGGQYPGSGSGRRPSLYGPPPGPGPSGYAPYPGPLPGPSMPPPGPSRYSRDYGYDGRY